MAGEPLDSADVGWHGLRGDRRLAFRRLGETNGFPWLTASKLPELLLFTPVRSSEYASSSAKSSANAQHLPTHIRTPEGRAAKFLKSSLKNW